MKKTIALTLLSLASVFALSTTAVKAEENVYMETDLTTIGGDIGFDVPKSLEFEDFVIHVNEGDQSVNAKTDLSINVSDLRGTGAGWEVTAFHGGLKLEGKDEEKYTLAGSTISLNGGTLTSNADVNTNAPTLNTTPSLSIGLEPVLISKAAEGKGMGLWSHTWAQDNVKLTIPATVARDMYKGNYSTTITWTLAATPSVNTEE